MTLNSREAILAAARLRVQAHGYGGLSFRDLAAEVGIKAPSIFHHFANKAELGAAVARRYREDAAAALAALAEEGPDARASLARYPATFRGALENGNRLCLASVMAAELADLPPPVQAEVRDFAAMNIAWLAGRIAAAGLAAPEGAGPRARAVFAAVAGAQLLARGGGGVAAFDAVVDSYRAAGLIPS
ncbi:TetR family transcriptional regulator [Pseudoroseomonas deserti]|uniref:TetR family transcriptional regulator n=1 Tax=Teichococcus deserti TaxID=1817963 RepID=A0A1V2GYE5_9PROT|nr:TetR/AcrR family transcriptional regulator [Pseudoroseomonas deserti]ONG50085.1 TetR family transcriptional regulator [Pseudoroseomonas deserti]